MCGIAGIINKNIREVTNARLKQMTDAISHRGPDGEGQWISEDGQVGLAHRRLSIIDLSEHANQPMHYMGRYSIVFNGEIYNYVELKETLLKQGFSFQTSSDTEVLMALYHRDKEKSLELLDGMFAFVIYDNEEKTVFCARDRFGEKPFHYYYEEGKCFLFGSEMKALWSGGVARNVSESMLYNYMKFGLLANPDDQAETFFKGIKRLEHSHYIKFNTISLKAEIKRYWDIDLNKKSNLSIADACETFRDLFFTSVKRRLRSDVPVGSSLSGGLDSSLVVCVIDALNSGKQINQKTFSAQFPGFERDEARFQQIVIDRTHADAYFTFPDADVMLKEIDKVCYHQEEPFGSSSIMAQYEVFRLAKDKNVTVLLDGQGADEILAGYHFYYKYFFLELEKNKHLSKKQWDSYVALHGDNKVNGILQKDIKYKLRNSLPFVFDIMKKVKKTVTDQKGDFSDGFFAANKETDFDFKSNFHTLNAMLKQSTMGGSLQDLLRYADRNSMAHSREVRLPFLSHELVEFIYSLPATYKINDGWNKYIMRKAFDHILPSQITWRKDKIGYEPPQKQWMQRPEVKEIIREKRQTLVSEGILQKSVLDKEITSTAAVEQSESWKIWMAGKLLQG